MRYLGGKTRNAKAITDIIIKYLPEHSNYVEPFAGGLSIAEKIPHNNMWLNDYHKGLITLYKAIQSGEFKLPIDTILVDEYNSIKNNYDENNPLHTAVGFGLSYAGKWFGGYDTYYDKRGKLGATTKMLNNSLIKTFNKDNIKNAKFTNLDYKDINVVDSVIYCDPPYANTTEYKSLESFNHDEFWNKVRRWSENNIVLVSEFNAPEDFECIWDADYKVQMCKEQKKVTEKLFKLRMGS